MKQLHYLILIVFCIVFVSSCKKGEGDPFLSLRTRKARMSNTWVLKRGFLKIEEKIPGQSTEITTYDFDETSYIVSSTANSTNYKEEFSLTMELTKKGELSFSEAFGTNFYQGKGTWDFKGSVGEEKKKESVSFQLSGILGGSNYLDVFNKSNMNFSYHIQELRDKKLVLNSDYEMIHVSSQGTEYYISSNYEFFEK